MTAAGALAPEDVRRFWAKVQKTDDCWTWTAGKHGTGYGAFRYTPAPGDRRMVLAHRAAYELEVGPIPDGLELDHLCRNRACVRPDHLEPVTHAENLARSPITAQARQAAKTHCKNGHPFDEANTYRPARGGRMCRACRADRMRAAR